MGAEYMEGVVKRSKNEPVTLQRIKYFAHADKRPLKSKIASLICFDVAKAEITFSPSFSQLKLAGAPSGTAIDEISIPVRLSGRIRNLQ
jgi:hypothetical protein